MSDRLRIGLIGCGQWGKYILRDLVSLNCSVTVVARSDESQAQARKAGASSIVGHLSDLPEVDGAVIATPTTTHFDLASALLQRHIPLFIEKPLTTDVVQAEALVEKGANHIFVMDKWRYHPGVEFLADIARSGELGQVRGLRLTRQGWRTHVREVDVAWYLAPHDLSIILEVLGDIPPPHRVAAGFIGNHAAEIVALMGDDPWVMVDISERHEKNTREVRLICERGTAVLPESYSEYIGIMHVDDMTGPCPCDTEKKPISTEMPLLRELRAFTDHCRGGPPPRSNANDALLIVKRINAMRRLAGIHD